MEVDKMEQKNSVAFIAGPPVRGNNFFGRKSDLAVLSDHLVSGNSILLVGQRRIGKSSILAQIQHLQVAGELDGVDTNAVLVSLDGNMLFGESPADNLSNVLVKSIQNSIPHQPSKIAEILRRVRAKALPKNNLTILH
jgi:hypothetical protein